MPWAHTSHPSLFFSFLGQSKENSPFSHLDSLVTCCREGRKLKSLTLELSDSDVLYPAAPIVTIPKGTGRSGARDGRYQPWSLSWLSLAVSSTIATSHLGEESVYFILDLTVYHEGKSGEELKEESQGRN